MTARIWVLAVCALFMTGCHTTSQRSGYWSLMNRPIPTTDEQRDAECGRIRAEIARMQTIQQMAAPGPTAIMVIAQARDNVAALESRRSQIQCDVIRVAPTKPVTTQRTDFDQCFAKCREVTSRSESECFDSCK